MKKIIAVDIHVLQAFNAPYFLNLNLLAELKTYIDDPSYRVFIYITKPLKNQLAIFKKLQQEKIIDSYLENNAHIIDFSAKKFSKIVLTHIRELEKNINQISEFIAVGLPHNQRFDWLQEMATSIVDWKESTKLSLAEVLHKQLDLGDQPTEMKTSLSQNRQGTLNSLSRYKRELPTILYPKVDPLPAEGYCKQVLAEMRVMRKLIEEENPFPEYITLRNFHYANLVFDAVHFFLEVASVTCIIIHIYHSSHVESHLKEWITTFEAHVVNWLKKIENIMGSEESNLLTPSAEPRDERMSGEVNLSTAVPGPSNVLEPDAENSLSIGSSSSSSKSSISSADSTLSIKSSPAFYVPQSGLTKLSSSLQSTEKALSLESFFLPSSQRQLLKAKSALIPQGLTLPKLKKTDSKTSKKFGSKKKFFQASGIYISTPDERKALIPKESVLIDYHATSADQLTSQRSTLVKPNTVANQEAFSEELVSTRAQCIL